MEATQSPEAWSEQQASDNVPPEGLETIASEDIVAKAASFARGAGRHGNPVDG